MKTILHIVGNRPQFIKLAVLHKELASNAHFKQQIIHTGQHYSSTMSDVFFEELNIPLPDVNFNIQNSSPFLFVGQAADALYNYFSKQTKAVVFVYGDTNTTLAASLAATKSDLPLLHFEAGVRTYDNAMPEETNRILTDRLANVNYCCTALNLQTMQREGFAKYVAGDLLLTGDLMLDAFLKIPASDKRLTDHSSYVLCTIHREANLLSKEKLTNIIVALNRINKEIPVILPLHPHTEKRLKDYNIAPQFSLLPALGYMDMKSLMANAEYIITDSGGASREAYFLQKTSLIIMDTPFWPEILNANCSLSTQAKTDEIVSQFYNLPSLQADFTTEIFGDGNAAKKIHQHLSGYLAE